MRERGAESAGRGVLIMASLLAMVRGRLAAADGFTLIELLVAAAVALVIIGGSVGVVTAGLRSEPRIAERTADIQAARVAMERLTREVRQGSLVTTATSSQLSVVTNVNSATCGDAASAAARLCRVTYVCSAGQCTRSEADPDGAGASTPVVVVRGISADPVFTYTPSAASPTYVGVALEFPAREGDDSITLTDGVTMRNAAAPAS